MIYPYYHVEVKSNHFQPVIAKPFNNCTNKPAFSTEMKPRWHNTTSADGDTWLELEGDIYFPLSSIRQEYLLPSSTTTVCPRKGTAHYYDVVVDGEVNKDTAGFLS